MAVKRLWLANAPSGTVDALQKAQTLVGWPIAFITPTPTPPEPTPVIVVSYVNYLRSYLGDAGETVTVDSFDTLADIDSLTNIDTLTRG